MVIPTTAPRKRTTHRTSASTLRVVQRRSLLRRVLFARRRWHHDRLAGSPPPGGAAEADSSPDADELEFGMSGTGVQGTGCDARRGGAAEAPAGRHQARVDRRWTRPQPGCSRALVLSCPGGAAQDSATETAVSRGTPARQADPRPLGPLVASQGRIRPTVAVRPRRCPGRSHRHPFGCHRIEPAGGG